MKHFNKHILEAINRGVQLALDDYEDDNQLSSKSNIIKNAGGKELWNLYNGFVDLGLPSGTMWAKYNLGCDWNKLNNEHGHTKPEDWYGNYYAWGEIEPKQIDSKTGWNNYKFVSSIDSEYRPIYTKYVTDNIYAHGHNIRYADNLTTLLPEDDAAYQYDNIMKMPSEKQFNELIDNCLGEWVIDYNGIIGLNGAVYKADNGNEIFFPASGAISQEGIRDLGKSAFLYSNKISSLNLNPIYLEIWGSKTSIGDVVSDKWGKRYRAFSIRPVLK